MEQLKRIAAAKKLKKNLKLQVNNPKDDDSDASLTSDDEEEVSKNITGRFFNNRYFCLKYLGRGTFSRVWLVYDLQESKFRAMKMHFPEFYEDASHEIKVMKKLNNKDNQNSRVVKMYDYFVDGKSMCVIYELMGKCLLDIFRKYQDEPAPIELVKIVIRDILKGLDEAHKKKIIHTDLKPENILLNTYSQKIESIKNWFLELKPGEKYLEMFKNQLPENYDELPAPKKKTQRKKAKLRAHKQFMQEFGKLLVDYNGENPDSKFDSDNDTDISDLELSDANLSEANLSDVESRDIDIESNTCTGTNLCTNLCTSIEGDEMSQINLDLDIKDNIDTNIDTNIDLNNLVAKLVDFGNGEFQDNLIQDEIGLRCYRCPENIMNESYNTQSDIWVVGCITYELITGEYLFDVEKLTKSIDRDRQHLHQMYEVLGKIPKELSLNCDFTDDLFDNKGRILKNKQFDFVPIEDILVTEFNYSDEYAEKTADFLLKMLEYDPKKRYTAEQCLAMDWLK